MNKLKVKLENCYGIKKLEEVFEFDKKNSIYAIYAPNGVMKTSFAKVITDYVDNKDADKSRDQIFNKNPYTRIINDENDSDYDKSKLFVIGSYVDTTYSSDKISTLLVRNELREEYEKALGDLVNLKKPIINKLAGKDSSNSSDCEDEIIRTFTDKGENFFEIIHSILSEIELVGEKELFEKYHFKYNDIFDNTSVDNFLKKNGDSISLYHSKYYEILKKSDGLFSEDGSFGTLQASSVAKSVSDNTFFKAGHKFILNNTKEPIKSFNDFESIIEEAKNKVLSDPDVKKQFEKIDSALAPATLNGLREIIRSNKDILLELVNFDEFRKKYWFVHLYRIIDDLKSLDEKYLKDIIRINEIVNEANTESHKWKEVIRIFKNRFNDLPFEVDVENKKDAVLGLNQPKLIFIFRDKESNETKIVERDSLTQDVLSNGEKRAFYLLNIIFEIESRKNNNQETLFIIDDIADSFDYKNKYAIVEYLHDISSELNNFSALILTHNFDFYRTITLRLDIPENKRFYAQRESTRISLFQENDICPMDPFKTWKNDLSNHCCLLALIPFARNLIEYGKYDYQKFLTLTSILHNKKNETYYKKQDDGKFKPVKEQEINLFSESSEDFKIKSTSNILFSDLEVIFKEYLGINLPSELDLNEPIVSFLMKVVENINNNPTLENKIVLAMSIRHIAEEYMIMKINNQNWVNSLRGSQTCRLLTKLKGKIKCGDLSIDDVTEKAQEILERIVILTPENIHINSFMYEPIIDMGITELKELYNEAKQELKISEL